MSTPPTVVYGVRRTLPYLRMRNGYNGLSAVASGVFVSVMLMVLLLEEHLPTSIGRLPVVGA